MDDLTCQTIDDRRRTIDDKQRTMSVCFISLDAYPLFSHTEKGIHGGSEVDIYMLSTELAKDKKFRVGLITGDYGQRPVEQFEDVTIYKTKDLRNPVAAVVSIWKAMGRANADIYFKKGASFITALVGLFCKVNNKILVLRTARDIECDGTYIRENWLRGRAFLWALKQAKQVFVQKDTNKAPLKETTGVSAIVLPNGHRILEASTQNRDCILWAGRSTKVKQPQLFIKLAKEIPQEQFIMICQQAKDDNKYDELLASAKTIPNLTFIERVPFHEIDSFFQRAKIFVNTSSSEGFPNTFIQACKCSTPILSLNINPDRFLDQHNCGFCAYGDWSEFVSQLKKLISSNKLIELGQNARAYAEKNHNIETIIERYKQVFRSVT
jgi:glycosyltransferase involved in cell wall biosynthesis